MVDILLEGTDYAAPSYVDLLARGTVDLLGALMVDIQGRLPAGQTPDPVYVHLALRALLDSSRTDPLFRLSFTPAPKEEPDGEPEQPELPD